MYSGEQHSVWALAFSSASPTLAVGSTSGVDLWNVSDGELLLAFGFREGGPVSVAFHPSGQILASARNKQLTLQETTTGNYLTIIDSHSHFISVAFSPSAGMLASGGEDRAVKLWHVPSGRLLRSLEGHTSSVDAVAFSPDGKLLASKSRDGTVRLWSCEIWETVAVIPELTHHGFVPSLAFHPNSQMLVTSGSTTELAEVGRSRMIHFWELDRDVLLRGARNVKPALKAVHHTTAKIVLVGDHSVGKSGLGWRLAHGEFKEQASTHGQQFWVLPQLGKLRDDGTECEAILWDLAGQPDYRLIHALFLDDVDLALVLFDSSNITDPLRGVEFWLKQLNPETPARLQEPLDEQSNTGGEHPRLPGCQMILVGSQADRGTSTLTAEELHAFCVQRAVSGYFSTSAKAGTGISELVEWMQRVIPWDDKPATVTTITFKRIKDHLLKVKENLDQQPVIVTPKALRVSLEKTDSAWPFSDAEMMTAVGHLENYGYVKRLRTSKGEQRILLVPELLNNLAASFVLAARRNEKGLGSLEEKRLLAGDYSFPELENIPQAERDILLDSAALLFLEHNICFRETDPLNTRSYLVFPQLINLKKPTSEIQATEDGLAYSVSGAVENVYASLVVLLGYTQTFTRTDQWHNHASYEFGDKLICGFRQEVERDGELEFVLYFGANVPSWGRTLFQGLFESFLGRRNLTVSRYEPVKCNQCGQPLDRSVVRTKLRDGKSFTFCNDCGEKLLLPKAHEPIQLTQQERAAVETQRRVADLRTRFEQAIYSVQAYVKAQAIGVPECFISYAGGDKSQERWVEHNLATDLQKAGITVLLDRWENTRAGRSIPRFIERIEKVDRVIVVGTPLYRKKYENKQMGDGFVAAEADLISTRLLGTEAEKETVLPALLEGEAKTSLPPLLQSRVHSDFRNERGYFITAFDLILNLYGISHGHAAVADLRELLGDARTR